MFNNSHNHQKIIIMKKTIITFTFLFLMAASSLANSPSEKVLKIFHSTFISAMEVKWYDHEDYYDVNFVQSGIRASVKYDKEGNFISSRRYYGEQTLPVNIRCQIKKKYPNKKIFGVTEITNTEEINYYIKLQDDKHWITLKSTGNGYLEMIEKYRKA